MIKKFVFYLLMFSFLSVQYAFAFENLFHLQAPDIDGEKLSLRQFEGQVVLIVNTASKCGYTYQYEGLEKVYRQFKERGVVVLGFPSDAFWQEYNSNEEIKEFCEGFQISFPLFADGPVRGSEKHEVFRFLTEQSGMDGEIRWNFEKFLLDRDGNLVRRYRSGQDPDEDPLLSQIETLL